MIIYRKRQNQDIIHNAEKWLMLETIDQAWKQHMLNLDHLKEGISLRHMAKKIHSLNISVKHLRCSKK